MVKKKSLWKNIYREILRSAGRFLAILGIIALGSGFFIGLRCARGAMVKTVNTYLERTRFFDFSLVSTLGYSKDEAAGFSEAEFVEEAEGTYRRDALVSASDDEDTAVSFLSLPSVLNLPEVKEGRLPERENECLADASIYGFSIGDTVRLSEKNDEETLDDFAVRTFTVVGMAESPLYLNYERGTTSLASGSLAGFFYIPYEGFSVDYYSGVYIRLTDMPEAYSEAYETRADELEEQVKTLAEELAHDRYLTLYEEAEQELADGIREYEDGLKEYEEERAEAEQELADAKQELDDAKKELEDARKELDRAVPEIADGRRELEQKKAEALTEFADAQRKLEDAKKELDEGKAEYEAAWGEYINGETQYQIGEHQLRESMDPFGGGQAAYAGFMQQQAEAQLSVTRRMLDEAKGKLQQAKKELDDGQAEYDKGVAELVDAVETYNREVADAERKLADAERKRVEGEQEYKDGLKEYEDGIKEYEEAEQEAEEEFAKAERELEDAAREIEDAKADLATFTGPDVYVLGRFSNIGYACYDNDSAIVQSIATVFPVFFFLVAALICMTTIGRMVDEQRGQLGVLYALGYSPRDTMLKYMVYAGLATALGAVAGIVLGSSVIPQVLWKAYSIMYTYTKRLEYDIDVPLSVLTFLLYLAAMLIVTRLSARATLKETPAQILRPKPPKAGRRVLLEKIGPLWTRLSFMWKVTMRNVFRYRDRVLMMVLGVAGCTALMITGFGIRDSIQNVVDYQYDEITLYDYEVQFDEAMNDADQEAFRESLSGDATDILFAHQESVTARNARNEKNAYLTVIPEPERVQTFISLKSGGQTLPYPGTGEALINVGCARALRLSVGDTLTVRTDARVHTFTVSGIFDNYIYNYVFVNAETYRDAEKKQPEIKTAFVCGNQDRGDLTGILLQDENVLNVTAGTLLRERIGSIMENLIYIVLLTIVCAAALAFIVIYNLTNINVGERVSEIATVKVLGFYPQETAGYVLRENVILTILGALLGIPLGIALNAYVVNMIRVDLVYFTPRIHPVSYLYGIVLTMLFGAVVDFVMALKLNGINEAVALKAAE